MYQYMYIQKHGFGMQAHANLHTACLSWLKTKTTLNLGLQKRVWQMHNIKLPRPLLAFFRANTTLKMTVGPRAHAHPSFSCVPRRVVFSGQGLAVAERHQKGEPRVGCSNTETNHVTTNDCLPLCLAFWWPCKGLSPFWLSFGLL